MPGEEHVYTVSLQNIGNVNDTYRIWVDDLQPGWEFSWSTGTENDASEISVELESALFKEYGAVNTTELQLRVRIPTDEIGGEISYITIKGVSILSENEQAKDHPAISLIERKDTMFVKIGNVPKLHIFCDENKKYIMPGERAKFNVYVKNNGNVDYTVMLSYSEPTTGWFISAPKAVDVRSAEQKLIEVFLTAPAEEYQTQAETHEMIGIEGRVDTNEGTLSSSVGVIGILGHVRHMNVTVTPAVNTTVPGGAVGYTALIENLGNSDLEVVLNPYSLELGWALLFPDDDSFLVMWKETVAVRFQIHVSTSALAGTITNILNVSDISGENTVHVNVKTVVLQTHDLGIGVYTEDNDLYTAGTTQYITPGSQTMYDIRVENKGNGIDTAAFSLYLKKYTKPAPGGGLADVSVDAANSDAMMADAVAGGGVIWYVSSVQSSPGAFSTEPVYWDFSMEIPVDPSEEVRYQPDDPGVYPTHLSMRLLPGQSAWLQITVDYPVDELKDPMYFETSVASTGEDIKPDDNTAGLNLEIKFPDLAFDETLGKKGLDIIGKRSDTNAQLNIQVKLLNIGEIEARDIVIALYVDDQFLDSRTVMRLVNSSGEGKKDILISFAWKPVQGKHKIEVRLDPDNSVIELNENNNVVNENIVVKGEGLDSIINNPRSVCSVVFIVIAAIVVVITAYIVRQQRKQNKV
jgi:hypothetical protein